MNVSEQKIIEQMRANPNVGMKLLMDAYQEETLLAYSTACRFSR